MKSSLSFLNVEGEDARADAGTRLDDAERSQGLKGFADDGAADLKASGECVLGRESTPRSDPFASDHLLDGSYDPRCLRHEHLR